MTDAASCRSLSSSSPDEAPSNTAKFTVEVEVLQRARPHGSGRIRGDESQVEDPDDPLGDQVQQDREPLARHLAGGELDDQVAVIDPPDLQRH